LKIQEHFEERSKINLFQQFIRGMEFKAQPS